VTKEQAAPKPTMWSVAGNSLKALEEITVDTLGIPFPVSY